MKEVRQASSAVPLEKGEINPVFINSQKGYTEGEKKAVLSRYKNLFASAAKIARRNRKQYIQKSLDGAPDKDRMSLIARVKRDIKETEKNNLRDIARNKKKFHEVKEDFIFSIPPSPNYTS
ncbi:uncharacterized protein LOC129000426 [Macrosteles quadrilineatus]|uniref:uncharacterized protein LOC129000426 n=1 Tax=Macrosteles quadrilineatus TaxID=74068 RepID=UPI0023E1469C|nr:uncharacterized protein LOC129000426 [Macrosteles quadrilineatus]